MSRGFRIGIIAAGLFVMMLFFYSQRQALEAIRKNGTEVLLPLRPVDPRDLMMGDYMRLAYALSVYPDKATELEPTGLVVLSLDQNKVGSFTRMDDGSPPGSDELYWSYVRKFNGQADYGGDRFYFQEGHAALYEVAEYGVFRVSDQGRAVLIGLADVEFKMIDPDEDRE